MPVSITKTYLNTLLGSAQATHFLPNAAGDFSPVDPNAANPPIVAALGDLTGDGITDIVLGAPNDADKATAAGRIFVMSGVQTGTTDIVADALTNLMIIDGVAAGDRAGAAVGAIAYLNGNGVGEILIGAPGTDIAGAADAGAAYVVWGAAGSNVDLNDPLTAGGKGFVIKGQAAGDAAGTTITSISDLNGDGKADVLVGAIGQDAGGADAGAVYVVWGKGTSAAVNLNSVATGSLGFKIIGDNAGDMAGSAIAAIGDLNGDGKSEILIGTSASQRGGANSGAVYVVFGKGGGASGNAAIDLTTVAAGTGGFVINGVSGDAAGAAISGIGDVNGDGMADILVAAPGSNSAYVVFGKSDTVAINLSDVRNGIGGFRILGEQAGDLAGISVTGGRDFNHDGVADIVIGAPHNDEGGADAGAVYLIWGGGHSTVDLAAISASMGGSKIVGTAGSLTGAAVAITVDLNADGSPDLLISAPGAGDSAWLVSSQAGWQPDTNVYGTSGADVIGVGYGATHLVGDSADNVIAIGGNDTIFTAGGDDTIDGGTGADSMAGGTGNDTYYVDAAGDSVIEVVGEGTDAVIATASHTLAANVENLTLNGFNLTGTGNDLANTITGTTGADTIDGGLGGDTMIGGFGNDRYFVDSTADVVVEGTGQGTDTVSTVIDYTLGVNVENLILGTAGLTGTGNAAANAITGSSGADTLDGGLGADLLTGGLGDDIFVVDNLGDIVAEVAGQGTDTVRSAINVVLAANVENLVLTGAARIGTGNALANAITGTLGDDTLDGGAGADTLMGGAGNDTYKVDVLGDVVIENAGEGTDTVVSSIDYVLGSGEIENLTLAGTAHYGTGNAQNNVITGGTGDDWLDGAGGIDTLAGGAGNDHYTVDSITDVIVEAAGAGTSDTVHASVDFSLAGIANVENLILTGTAHHAIGNDGNNALTGGAGIDTLEGGLGNDRLDGGMGADTLIGGDGDDTYIIDNPGDVVMESAIGGNDTVFVSSDWTLAANIENVTLTGTGHSLVGNAAANTLKGDTGDDTLDGREGDDIEIGGDGDDRLISNSGHDTLAGGAGDDVYEIHGGSAEIEDFQGHDTIDASEASGDSHIDLSGDTACEIEDQVVDLGTGGTVTGALNVQFLQDLTGSFGDDIANVRVLVPQIVAALNGISGGAAFGASSFRDKIYGSFGGVGDYVYRTDLAMGATVASLTATYTGFAASGGADLPESQIEALMQLALRSTSEVGFQNNSARVVVVFTDASFHTAADGTGAGILTPNNGDAIINNGGILENYPELAQVKAALDAANIIPIFAVTAGLESTYQGLTNSLGRGNVVTLSANSANIVSAITTGLTTATTTHIAAAIGGGGHDMLIGNVGDNELTGNAGDDTLRGGVGDDMLHGGEGDDTAEYSGAITDYTITVNGDGTIAVTDLRGITGDGADTLDGVEFLKIGAETYNSDGTVVAETIVIGGDIALAVTESADAAGTSLGAALLTITSPAQFVAGVVNGLYGAVTIAADGNWSYALDNANGAVDGLSNGQQLVDTVTVQSLDGTMQALTITIGGTDDIRTGTIGDDVLAGTAGVDQISGLDGQDKLYGYDGSDRLSGGLGDDLLDGGAGIDTASYADATVGVRVNLSATKAQNTVGAGIDTLTSIENLIGSDFVDTLIGSLTDNQLDGGAGNDSLSGGAGNDQLFGGDGNDKLNGGIGDDAMFGGFGDDRYYIDSLGDTLVELAGQGTDSVTTAIDFTLGADFENLTFSGVAGWTGTGNELVNRITGGIGDDTLSGLGGKDVLYGGDGNDTLKGGAGADNLTGGLGADTFVFDTLGTSVDKDTIKDFLSGTDRLLFDPAIFTALSATADGTLDPSQFALGSAATTAAQHLIYNQASGALYYDIDGYGGTAKLQIATLATKPMLSAGDIMFA